MLREPEDIMIEPLRAALKDIAQSGIPPEFRMKGTTCVALAHKDGVVMATDGRATMGLMIGTEVFEKLFKVDSHSVVAVAGAAGMAQLLARVIEVHFSFEEDLREGAYIPPKTKVSTIVNLLQRNIGQFLGAGGVFPIFATYDMDTRDPKGRVFLIMPDGTRIPEGEFACVGSGSASAREAIETCLDLSGFREAKGMAKGLELKKAQRIAVYGLTKAHRIDAGTGGHVNMMLISRDGVRSVGRDEVRTLLEDIQQGRVTI